MRIRQVPACLEQVISENSNTASALASATQAAKKVFSNNAHEK
jgi:hypothetical protein